MSGLFGFFNRNGMLATPAIIEKISNAASRWKPDATFIYCNKETAMGQASLWNTPESKSEKIDYPQKKQVIIADVRLDNRVELSRDIGLPPSDLKETTDSDLILSAYAKWGVDCPKHLLGDFSFAIWDKGKQQLFCARDQLGVRPFYYHLKNTLFVFGNDLEAMVCHPDISSQLSDEAVANYLVNALLIHQDLTFFRDIQKLRPGHWILVDATTIQERCYWHAEDSPPVNLPDAEAYAARLRELLDQAVHDRLRTSYPVTSHLSGGLDSSAIAAIAARQLKTQNKPLLAFNWLHEPTEEDDPSCHEWANSRETAEQEAIDHHFVNITANDIFTSMRSHNIAYGDSAGFWYEYQVRNHAQTYGSRTIFSGWGGDELSTYHGNAFLSNLTREGRLIRLLQEIFHRAKDKKRKLRYIRNILYHEILLPCVPRKLYRSMPRNKHTRRFNPHHLQEDFLPLVEAEAQKQPKITMQPQSTIRNHMLAFLEHGSLQGRMTAWATSGMNDRVEYVYPLLDKRLVEFILGIPARYFVHQGIGRYIFRLAAKDLIPPKRLWCYQKQEINRADRLCSVSYSAYQMLLKDLSTKAGSSKYIKKTKLQKLLQLPFEQSEILPLISEIGTLLSVFQTEK